MKSLEIAQYFLYLAKSDAAGDLISNLKIQNLTYYAQGIYLGLFESSLFEEPIEAWTHGPVIPDLYFNYKVYGSEALPYPNDVDHRKYEPVQRFLEDVYSLFGQYSAWKLRAMTHQESPWQSTPKGHEITQDVLQSYFFRKIRQDPALLVFKKYLLLDHYKANDKRLGNAVIDIPLSQLKHWYGIGEISDKTFDNLITQKYTAKLKGKVIKDFYDSVMADSA